MIKNKETAPSKSMKNREYVHLHSIYLKDFKLLHFSPIKIDIFLLYKLNDFFYLTEILGMLKNENGITEEEENFEEAIRNVNTALVKTSVRTIWFLLLSREIFKNHLLYFLLNEVSICLSCEIKVVPCLIEIQSF